MKKLVILVFPFFLLFGCGADPSIDNDTVKEPIEGKLPHQQLRNLNLFQQKLI